MFGIGAGELIMILIAGLVIFGPGKLPEVGRAIGKGLREFRKAQAMFRATLDEVSLENEKKSVALEKPPAETVTAEKNVTADKAVTANKAVTLDKNIAADKPAENVAVDKTVSVDKNVTADKAVSVEKALPLENPTENISREKLVDATKEIYEEKKTAVSVDDVIQMAKDTSLAEPEVDGAKNEISAAENVSTADKVTAAESVAEANKNSAIKNNSTADKASTAEENTLAEKKTALNVYDVIEMAKNNSFVKEKIYEKIFGGTGAVTYNADVSKCINITRGGTDGT
ncbi:MAG: twin-arginine translocase TatA/TatE family subunit [Selenomonadaceae bacterium]|nr:twin-arginine translocase TatA/TatE family subunit [Selenomonadaceae bacterium]